MDHLIFRLMKTTKNGEHRAYGVTQVENAEDNIEYLNEWGMDWVQTHKARLEVWADYYKHTVGGDVQTLGHFHKVFEPRLPKCIN